MIGKFDVKFTYCERLRKKGLFPYFKGMLILVTLRYIILIVAGNPMAYTGI